MSFLRVSARIQRFALWRDFASAKQTGGTAARNRVCVAAAASRGRYTDKKAAVFHFMQFSSRFMHGITVIYTGAL
jgi:hypothetical protein